MKKEKDSRINASYVSIREYALFFLVLAAFNGFHMWIYQAMEQKGMFETNMRTAINLLMVYVLFMAALATGVIGLIRDRLFIYPIKKLSEAARSIARGNFSVRIAPLRKDEKKNFVDVLFDDFNTMAEELASIETLKNDFVANISHEIKTPLSVIQFYTSALQNGSLGAEERMEYTSTILEATKKLSVLITNILRLSKLENQEIVSEAKPFDLSEQLRRCALAFADAMEQKNIHFEEDLDEISVCCDAHMLEIVWNNLLSNAVKFTNPGGSVFMSLKAQNDSVRDLGGKQSVRISVSDTGCGIDEAAQKHIFDKFYQADTPHSKDGNGLGLALVRKTVDLLGGTVTVDSESGHGSTFTVCLKI